jgi:hypothetical protein
LQAETIERESLVDETLVLFDGDTDVGILDLVWKWARNGNPRDQNFTINAEYLRRSAQGTISQGPATLAYDEAQSGYYVSGTYQFRPRWRIGVRYDTYDADPRLAALPGIGPVGADPERLTVMVDFSNSEFSRLRLQVSDFDTGFDSSTGLYFQYIMSMGSHGAHAF